MTEDVIKDNNVDYAMIGYAENRLDKLITYILENRMKEIRDFSGLALPLIVLVAQKIQLLGQPYEVIINALRFRLDNPGQRGCFIRLSESH